VQLSAASSLLSARRTLGVRRYSAAEG